MDGLAQIQAADLHEIYGKTCNDLFKSTHTNTRFRRKCLTTDRALIMNMKCDIKEALHGCERDFERRACLLVKSVPS